MTALRRPRSSWLLLAAIVAAISSPARAQYATTSAGGLPVEIPFTTATGGTLMLSAMLYRPVGTQPAPLIVVSHGTAPIDADRRRNFHPAFETLARSFADQGYVTAVLMRRGYGLSEGPVAEFAEDCERADYVALGDTGADDIATAIAFLRRQSFVDPSRIVALGSSTGAWAGLALATRRIEGLRGTIDFATARGTEQCNAPRRLQAAQWFGAAAKVPALWLYADNDLFYSRGARLALFNAYRRAAPVPVDLVELPADGSDGHYVISSDTGRRLWQVQVNLFLEQVFASR